jgi:hypothetical protein
LVADLGSGRASTRDAAIARLTLLGPRAVDPLLGLLGSGAASAPRAAALRALEAIGDPRALDAVLDAIDADDAAIGCAAASAAGAFVRGPRGATAVDRLTATVLDRARNDAVRIAAMGALRDLEASTLAPLLAAVQNDPSGVLRASIASPRSADAAEVVTTAADRGLPARPEELGDAVTRAGGAVPLPVLLRIVERVRDREAGEPRAQRPAWTRVRGQVHAALAARGSRIALYDVRESLESASGPLPVEFLAALSKAGDVSCLDAIGAAYSRSSPAHEGPDATTNRDDWWRDHLVQAFAAIAKHEHLTPRHAVMKKVLKRWPAIVRALSARPDSPQRGRARRARQGRPA